MIFFQLQVSKEPKSIKKIYTQDISFIQMEKQLLQVNLHTWEIKFAMHSPSTERVTKNLC